MTDIVVIAHNLRSTHNVGSLLRTADGLGVVRVYLGGYTPYPAGPDDTRLPHLAQKISRQIAKTALGAESPDNWQRYDDIAQLIALLKADGYRLAALEQTAQSLRLPEFVTPPKIALVLGREVEGLEAEIVDRCDYALEIPMLGKKESFNVVQAAAMAMYHCRFTSVVHCK